MSVLYVNLNMDGHPCNLYLPLPLPVGGGAAADSAWPFLPLELPHPQDSSAGMALEEKLLRQALHQTTIDFESAQMAAQEELRRMKSHALHLTHLLHLATRERDDARHALFLLRQLRRHGDDQRRQRPPPPYRILGAVPALDFEEGGMGDDTDEEAAGEDSKGTTTSAAEVEAAAERRGLPERGMLVEAVMMAGPLLQTLLLAGPLPQWRHPPPELRCSDIPPVAISLNYGSVAREGADTLAATTGTAKSVSSPSTPSPPSVWNHSSLSSSPESGHSRSGSFPNNQKLACFSVV